MTKTWIITGSSRGLGFALVEEILKNGDKVVATARNPETEKLQYLVKQYGSENILLAKLDVTKDNDIHSVLASTKKKFGKVDILVNNAGYADRVSVEDMPFSKFKSSFDTNFFGVVNITKAILPLFREQGYGHIIQVSSIGDRVHVPGLSAYQSAKAAVTAFSSVLATEVEQFGIKVTTVEPGGIKTEWGTKSIEVGETSEPYKAVMDRMMEFRKQLSPAQTEPERIARAIIYITKVSNPPTRLLLGDDAFDFAREVGNKLKESDETWETVSRLKF